MLKEIRREIVNSCPCCESCNTIQSFYDWNGILYQVCRGCKTIFQNPRIIFEYEEKYWGEVVDPDGKKRILTTERDAKIKNWYGNTIKYVNSLSPGKILDVGAGLGYFLSALNSEWDKYALETSSYASDFIKAQYPDIKVQQCLLEDASFGNNQFDVIMFYHVIEHLENPKKELNILNNMLSKNGVLIVGTPNIGSIAAKIFQGNFRLYGSGHLCLFNPKSLNQILVETGFQVFRREYPFWKTDYATLKNILRMFRPQQLSPPFYGSVMTFYNKQQ